MKPSVIVWEPDLTGFAAANDLVGKSDVEVREAMGDKFPKHIYHSIVCIGCRRRAARRREDREGAGSPPAKLRYQLFITACKLDKPVWIATKQACFQWLPGSTLPLRLVHQLLKWVFSTASSMLPCKAPRRAPAVASAFRLSEICECKGQQNFKAIKSGLVGTAQEQRVLEARLQKLV
jgi:hypothetical protein